MSNLARHPELEALRERSVQLNAELHGILADLFVLEHDTFREVTGLYQRYFAEYEAELQRATLQASEMQRRVELVVVRSRHGRTIDSDEMAHINALVEREFSVYHRAMNNENSSTHKSETEQPQEVRDQRAAELQTLYRQLVKVLHPDVVDDTTLFERFWELVSDAYNRNDLSRLRTIHGVVQAMIVDADSNHIRIDNADELRTIEHLRETVHRLEMRVDYERRRYARLNTEEPYSLRAMLESEERRDFHAQELLKSIEIQRRSINAGKVQLQSIVGDLWEQARINNATLKERFDFQDEFIENTYFSMRA